MALRSKLAGATLAATIAIVGVWEGRKLVAYPDIVGVWTICDGDTRNVRAGQVASNSECDRRLYERLQEFDAELSRCITAPMQPNVHAAVLSLTYNVGSESICKSTLVRKLNAGDTVGACNEFPRWRFAGGKEIRGLLNRRKAEQAMCLADMPSRA